jgi:hypothetical protein
VPLTEQPGGKSRGMITAVHVRRRIWMRGNGDDNRFEFNDFEFDNRCRSRTKATLVGRFIVGIYRRLRSSDFPAWPKHGATPLL